MPDPTVGPDEHTTYLRAIQAGLIEPDFADKKKTVRSCMEDYSCLFGETRIPQQDGDALRVASESRHIAVLRGNDVYELEVIIVLFMLMVMGQRCV